MVENQQLEPDQLLKKSALLSIHGEDDIQYVNGVIAEFNWVENGTRFARYSISVVPMAWFLN